MKPRDQLELFPEPVDPELARLAAVIPPHVRFGTSSWTFEGWRGLVYHNRYSTPQAFVRDSLAEYARHPLFRTVGIDRSYYTPLRTEELEDYAAQLSEGFLCCMKVWSEITTRVFPRVGRSGDRAGRPNYLFLDPVAFSEHVATHLGSFLPWLGPLILELAPATPTDSVAFAAAVERFLERAPAGFHYAFELREPLLLTERYLDVLRAHPSASHVFNLHTRMPPIGEQLAREGSLMNGVAVARLMIPPGQKYAERRDAFAPFDRLVEPQLEMRADVLRLIDETAARSMELFVIANNKAEGSSPLTVREIVEMLDRRLRA